ncbi:DMT family transporter [Larkinella rosea]|uniref:DMT family transporter n=1 Tax=Larkinella rosea TaxID=2025312 RepID=A0A3P1BSG8_9BACT|nr:DMT family transporter [Larkinella rosea]RRB03863.1 DMT family transporter [Larkinella rosea]
MTGLQPPSSSRTTYWIGALLVFLAAFCFALKGVLIKLAYQYQIDTISLLTLRMVFALPFYVFIALKLSKRLPPVQLSTRNWLMLALLGIMGYYIASYMNFLGLVYITASLERILLFVYPTFVLLLGVVIYGRKVNRLQLLAVLLTYSGIIVAFVPNIGSGQQKDVFLGAFWVILSGLVYAVYLVGSDTMIARVGSQRYTCYAMIVATLVIVIHCLIANGLDLFRFPAPVYQLALLMAVLVTVIPTFLIAEGIKRIGSGNASIVASIGPIFTIILATTFLDETITLYQFLGTLLVLFGVFLIGWKGRK